MGHLKRDAHRARIGLAVGLASLGVVPATVSAHGDVGNGGVPVAFLVVVGAPVIAGVLGGGVAIGVEGRRLSNTSRRRVRIGFGLLLIALAGTFAMSALARLPLLCLVCGTAGALTTVWIVRREGTGRGHRHHSDFAFGAICAHRVLEGVVLGALFTASAFVGVVGVAAVASHAALETAVVGGVYRSHRLQALGAITLVQVGYTVGVLVGVVAGASIPVSVQTALFGLVAGVLLVVGISEASAPTAGGRPTG